VPGSGLGPNCFPALGSDPGLLNRGTPVTAAAANPEKINVYTFFLLTGAWLEAAQEIDKETTKDGTRTRATLRRRNSENSEIALLFPPL
jgi:hypothetical protein